ncbi:MAG: transglycosylase SLT domain-containing protein [Betaproteobacteria bacterium]|nr:transglycosylase SLT domain-containing protein [Betaproteobacteria bacterium]
MQPYCRALLIAAGLVFQSPLLCAADNAPAELVAPSTPTVDDAAPTAWPIAPPSRPFDREPGPEDIPSVQDPAIRAPQTPAVIDLTTAPTSLWQRIRNGFGLPDIATPLVREQEEWFANRQDYIKRTVARSSRYLYHIVEEVEKRGMPGEIALLPIIESAYNPVAYSRAHASGIWQFIPSTGKLYGLQQNFWYDGRRDVMAATSAALDYLEKLYDMFGSWDLALAAYNWGENAVSRAIAKNLAKGLPTDYRNLTMPLETRYYIPKLQAVKNIIANPAQYGIELADVPNQPYFTAVTTTRHIDVKLAAKLADVSLEEFVSLNPGYSRPVIRANSEQTLLLPADKADTFRANLENHSQPLVSWHAYKLRAGESIDRVAARHNISIAQLKQVNGVSGKRRVGPGSTLLVPARGSATPHLPDLPAPPVTVAKAPKKSGKYAQASRKGGTVKAAQKRKIVKKPAAKKTTTNGTKKIVLAQKPR